MFSVYSGAVAFGSVFLLFNTIQPGSNGDLKSLISPQSDDYQVSILISPRFVIKLVINSLPEQVLLGAQLVNDLMLILGYFDQREKRLVIFQVLCMQHLKVGLHPDLNEVCVKIYNISVAKLYYDRANSTSLIDCKPLSIASTAIYIG